ncbi:iron-dicitrate transporter substrate-binding subunit [Escherichia coli]|uniref:Iron-dicitrate transporter substrate-binding subunit n=1 Tax=Escherichia coli TaxID=562 RepID=A0A484YLW0_ECOLX|nr:iron-dicitrate transporter substrate-binding subunit [Escherichia coli]
MPSIGLEQLLAVNPAWLLVAHYREESIVKRWQQDPLWQMLNRRAEAAGCFGRQ